MRRREGGREGRGALEEEKHQFYKRVLPPARCPPVPLPQCPWLARHASLGGKRERKVGLRRMGRGRLGGGRCAVSR